jgi:hypothetical protein
MNKRRQALTALALVRLRTTGIHTALFKTQFVRLAWALGSGHGTYAAVTDHGAAAAPPG